MQSLGFKNILDTWEIYLEKESQETELRNKIELLLSGQPFVMFFKKGKEIYGATEEGRLTYAKLKSKEEGKGWNKEANFLAINLTKALEGHKVHNMFSFKDIKEIQIMDKEEVEKLLTEKAKKIKNINININPEIGTDSPPGTVQLQGDKE
jgi:hypothetical protein